MATARSPSTGHHPPGISACARFRNTEGPSISSILFTWPTYQTGILENKTLRSLLAALLLISMPSVRHIVRHPCLSRDPATPFTPAAEHEYEQEHEHISWGCQPTLSHMAANDVPML